MLPLLLFVVVIAVQSQAATAPRDSRDVGRATCAISGRVTEQETGRPVPRAIVRLVAASHRREAITDAQGHYEFTGLDPGEYALWATPGELIATQLAQAYRATRPMAPFAEPPSNITLDPGEAPTDINIALARALAIEGRISDPWDAPMANVEVDIMRADGTPHHPSTTIHTDDRGEFRIFALAPGRYHVCARLWSSSAKMSEDELRLVDTCHLASTSESSATDITLDSTDAMGIDIRVQRSGTYSVSGVVLDADDTLVDRATIGALRDDHSVSAYATTHAGQFVLNGLTPGRYALWASIGGPDDPFDPRPPAREREFGQGLIDIDNVDASGIVMTVSKARKIAGRVRFEGRAPSANELRMSVQMSPPQVLNAIAERPPVSAVDDELNFELAGVYRLPLVVGIQGLPDGWVLKSVRYDGRDITNVATDFGAAARARRLDVLVTNRVAKPAIRVTDDAGHPVTAYQVVVLPADPARWNGVLAGLPDAPSRDGVSKLGPTLPGDYLVAAITPDDYRVLAHRPSRIDTLRSIARRVTFAEGDERILELHLTRLPSPRQ